MNIHLDRSLGEPLYDQLYRQLRQAIERGELPPGERLPPTRSLAVSLGVGRQTVLAAYDLLLTEGRVTGQVGRGTYVA